MSYIVWSSMYFPSRSHIHQCTFPPDHTSINVLSLPITHPSMYVLSLSITHPSMFIPSRSHIHQCTFPPDYTSINGSQSSSGVINFVPADGPTFGDIVTSSKHLAGINFTGSVRTFTHLTKQVGENISAYNTYPKIVGGMLVCMCVNTLYCVEHCPYVLYVLCTYVYCVYCTV